jgi:ATP-dependent protease ClpP protease subunit
VLNKILDAATFTVACMLPLGVMFLVMIVGPSKGWFSYGRAYLITVPLIVACPAAAVLATYHQARAAAVVYACGLFIGVILLLGAVPTTQAKSTGTCTTDELFQLDSYVFGTDVSSQTANDLIIWLFKQIKSGVQECLLVLNTSGGDIVDTMAIYDWIRVNGSRLKVHILVNGQCASGGTTILMSVPQERRYGTPKSYYMVHPATCHQEGGIDVRLGAQVYDAGVPPILDVQLLRGHQWQQAAVVDPIAHGTGLPEDQVRALLGPVDRWFNAQEALRLGLIGSILSYPE